MNSRFKGAALAAAVALATFTTPVFAQAEAERDYTEIVASGSDADKTIARARVAKQIIEAVLADWSFAAIRGETRKKLFKDAFTLLQREKFKPRKRSEPNGKYRYTAWVTWNEARKLILNAMNVRKTFGRDPFIIVAYHKDWLYGANLPKREIKVIHRTVEAACSDYMNSHGFRESPRANNREKVLQSAISLGADPQTTMLKDFSNMFQAPLVVTIKGNIKCEPIPSGTGHDRLYQARLRCQGVYARLYDKNSDTILARFNVKSDKSISKYSEATAGRLPVIYVGHKDSLSEATEKYASLIGRTIAINVMKRLFDTFYASQPQPKVTVKSSPRECPGCGDSIIDGSIMECPACESPLPKAKTTVVGTTDGRRTPTARDYYQLRFKGFTGSEVDDVVQTLEGNKDFDDWKDKGQMGVFHVYECTFVGKLVVRSVREALEDCGLMNRVKLTKTGNNVNLLKKARGK